MKTLALAHTRVAVSLAVNVKVQEDGAENLFSLSLVSLTPILFWLLDVIQWGAIQWLDLWHWGQATLSLLDNLGMACLPFLDVGCIILKSVAWGLGLRL